jgi:ABC-2 type transport system permease protein
MPSRTSFFNKTIFLKNVARFWPLWVVYLAAWLLFLLSTLLGTMDFGQDTGYTALGIGYALMQRGISSASIITSLGSLFAAMAVYAYMYSAKSAHMLSSLPIRRESLFMTSFFSGLVWLVAAPVVALAVTGIVEAGYGVFGAAYLLQLLAAIVLQTVFFYGLASFCAVLTGHLVALPILFTVVNVLAYVLEELLHYFLDLITYGLPVTYINISRIFSPFARMLVSNVELVPAGAVPDAVGYVYQYKTGFRLLSDGTLQASSDQYDDWVFLGCCAAAGLLLAVFAVLIYKKRHMEAAADVVAVAPLKPVFKYAMTFGGAVILGAIFYLILFDSSAAANFAGLVLATLAGAFVGYFSAQMLLDKSLRVFRSGRASPYRPCSCWR